MGQRSKTTVDQRGKTIVCKTDNFVPLVPGTDVQFWYQFRPLHRHHRICLQQVQHKSEVTKSHQETGATHPKLKTKIKRGITIEPRTTVCETFPEWLEEVTDSLEDTEVLAPAHMSHDSDSERPTQVALGNCSVYTHFPKRPGLRSMLANQDDKGLLAEDALPKQYLEQKSWVT